MCHIRLKLIKDRLKNHQYDDKTIAEGDINYLLEELKRSQQTINNLQSQIELTEQFGG